MTMEKAREDYMKIVGEQKLKKAEKAFAPKVPPCSLKYAEKVLVYSETSEQRDPRSFLSSNEPHYIVLEPKADVQP